jgi:hypothetical protein
MLPRGLLLVAIQHACSEILNLKFKQTLISISSNQSMLKKIKQLAGVIRRIFQIERRLEEIKINQGRILAAIQKANGQVPLWKHEFKIFSQWGEDGIIQYLVSHLDIRHCSFIEFGVEDFNESNCRFLMMKDQWHGFVIDGSSANIAKLRSSYYYWQHRLTGKAAFITRENIVSLLEESHFPKDLGILSVDIDGVDYHVLEALHAWRPAIIVVEYNDVFGWRRPVSVPYDPLFVRRQKHPSNQYWGANLPAFQHLANGRGYALVGTNSVGSNAFFVRRDLLNQAVCEVGIEACVREASFRDSRGPAGELTFLGGADRAKVIASMPLIDVSTGATLVVGDLDG